MGLSPKQNKWAQITKVHALKFEEDNDVAATKAEKARYEHWKELEWQIFEKREKKRLEQLELDAY